MPIRSRLAVITLAASALFAACSSGTTAPPAGSAAQTLARHLDTLLTQTKALANDNSAYNLRIVILDDAEIGAYLGALPSNISVLTAGGGGTWRAVELEDVEGADSLYFLIGYADTDLHTAFVSTFGANGVLMPESVELVVNDTIQILASDASGNTAPLSVAGACTLATGLVNTLPVLANGTCTQAKFTTTMSLTFPAHDGVSTSLGSISFSGQTVNGERLVAAPVLARLLARYKASRAMRKF